MGCSFHAMLIAGFKTTRDALYQVVRVAACEHAKPTTAKFCPECGGPVTMEERRPIYGYDARKDMYKEWSVCTYADYELIVVGIPISHLADNSAHDRYEHPLPDMGHLKLIVDGVLNKLKDDPIVTDKSRLAVWHVLDVSC